MCLCLCGRGGGDSSGSNHLDWPNFVRLQLDWMTESEGQVPEVVRHTGSGGILASSKGSTFSF